MFDAGEINPQLLDKDWTMEGALVLGGDLDENIYDGLIYPPNTIKPVQYSSGWIPFAESYTDEQLAVDLDPAPAGTKGQIIIFGSDVEYYLKVADSFDDFCQLLIDHYEHDRIHRWLTGRGNWGHELYNSLRPLKRP